MPKQNRPMVRDGRLQAPKKRTDRSYLTPTPATPLETAVEETPEVEADVSAPDADVTAVEVEAAVVATAPTPTSSQSAAAAARATGAERALQQQGVRKRREFDVQALARRDTRYAYHELRRIAILATMVVITLIVLTFVLR